MAKVVSEKQVNNFVKGLITESSPLTYPENASIDEENFELLRSGMRKRRLGIDYEQGYSFNTVASSSAIFSSGGTVGSFIWNAPGGDSSLSVLCIKSEDKVYFFDAKQTNPSAYPLSLAGSTSRTFTGTTNSIVTWAVVNGILLIGFNYTIAGTSGYIGYIDYRPGSSPTITSASIGSSMQIRDFFGSYESQNPEVRPRGVNINYNHNYNLLNQGWTANYVTATTTDPILETDAVGVAPIDRVYAVPNPIAAVAAWPSNADIQSYGKDSNPASANYERFNPLVMYRNSNQTAWAPKGKVILSYLVRGIGRATYATPRYSAAAGGTGLLVDTDTGSLTCVASYAGRAWYSGFKLVSRLSPEPTAPNYTGYLFFSQLVKSNYDLTKCYQENDPTSDEISDIVDTDGGTINIVEAVNINNMVPLGNSLLVFAENGIWKISGTDTSVFTPTSYTVEKVTNIGTTYTRSIVPVGNSILYWNNSGIYLLSIDPNTGALDSKNISISSIQTYYETIPSAGRQYAKGFFDSKSGVVRWLYNDSTDYSSGGYINTYTKQLNLDLVLNSFYKYEFSNLSVSATNLPRIAGFVETLNYASTNIDYTILAGADTVIANADTVIITQSATASREGKHKYLVIKGATATLAELNNTAFYDWKTEDGTGVDAPAYLITGYEYAGDIMREKQIPYVQFYFNRTEDGFTAVGDDLTLDNQSSCLVQAQWNWANSANSGKWGQQFQAYRLLRNYVPSGAGDPFDYGDSVIVTKNKLRGSGKVVSLKIQSEPGKDLQLLGWTMMITGKSEA